MAPKVSVIMGIYNCCDSLPQSIESILNQSFTDWELIMCDDASSDDTYNVAKEYKDKFPDKIILLQNNTNMKLAATLNNCLKVANGEYVARMDADDIAEVDRFKLQVEFLDNNEDISVVGGAAKISDGNTIIGIRYTNEIPTVNDVMFNPPFIHPTIMMRKKVYDALNGYTVAKRTQRGQDWDMWFRFFAAGYKGANLQEPMIVYHESKSDMKKRTLKAAIGCSKNAFYGYKTLHLPIWKYVFVIKPIISFFIPESLKRLIRKENNIKE